MSERGKYSVHVVGTGTIGEPLIGLLTDLKDELGIAEVTFSKRQALLTDRSKVVSLMRRGAKLCSAKESWGAFEEIGCKPSYEIEESFDRADVIIDCTPTGKGIENKQKFYDRFLKNTKGFIAQGSEFGFGKMYARGINDRTLEPGKDRFIHVVSCNTHNLAVLVESVAMNNDSNANSSHLVDGRFVCVRRANDISQDSSFSPSPQISKHDEERFGTHHARDAYHLFKTMNMDLNIYSSAMKINTQYMHTVWFSLTLDYDITVNEVVARFKNNPRVALTYKNSANSVFSFGRDHGHYGRILNQTVVVQSSLAVRNKREVIGFCFTPQDGNALLSSVAASSFFLYPDHYQQKLKALDQFFFSEV